MTQRLLRTWNPQQVKSPNLCSAPRHDKARLSITNTTFFFSFLSQFAQCCCFVPCRLTWFCNTAFFLTGLRDNPVLSHLETPNKNTLSLYGVPLILAEVFMDHGSHSTVSCIPASPCWLGERGIKWWQKKSLQCVQQQNTNWLRMKPIWLWQGLFVFSLVFFIPGYSCCSASREDKEKAVDHFG